VIASRRWTDELARRDVRRVERLLSHPDVTLHVFDDHDGVVDDEADRENDGEQRQQVQREPEDLHQEDGADEGHRNRHHRHEHRPQRPEEEEDDHHDDEHVSSSVWVTSSMALLMYLVESNAMLASIPVGSSF